MRVTLLIITLVMFSMTAGAGEPEAMALPDVNRLHVVLMGGINKDPEEIRSKDRAMLRLVRYFADTVGVPPGQLHVLAARDSFVTSATGESTADTVRATLAQLASLTTEDRLLIYYTGQANLVGESLRLNLPGPDLTHTEFAEALAPLHPGLMIVVLDCPGAGMAAKPLAAPDRVLIFSARSDQPTSTRFSDYFVPALEDLESDINGDGSISLLEAFQRTAQQLDALFRDQSLLKSENALLEDNGDGVPSQQPWTFAEDGNDGAAASALRLDNWSVMRGETAEAELSPAALARGDAP